MSGKLFRRHGRLGIDKLMEKLFTVNILQKNNGLIEIIPECDAINIYNSYLFETVIKAYVSAGIIVVLNLKNVTMISSTTIGMFLHLLFELENMNKKENWKITNITPYVEKTLKLAKIEDVLPISTDY